MSTPEPQEYQENLAEQTLSHSDKPVIEYQAQPVEPVEQSQTQSDEPVEQSQTQSDEPVEQSQTQSDEPVEQSQTQSDEPVEQSQTQSDEPVEQPQAHSDDGESIFEPSIGFEVMMEEPQAYTDDEEEEEEEGEDGERAEVFAVAEVAFMGLSPGRAEKMANKTAAAMKALVELQKLGTYEYLAKVTGTLAKGVQYFSFAGAIFGIVNIFLPDGKHKAIMREFEQLHAEIENVRDDIKQLEKMMKWEHTKTLYADVVTTIKMGVVYCIRIDQSRDSTTLRKADEDRLKELCSGQKYEHALHSLVEGLTGTGYFRTAILDTFYDKTGGHRPKMSQLGSRLVQILCSGIIVLSTYETLVRGEAGAKYVAETFEEVCKNVDQSVNSALKRCTQNFKSNMQHDLETVVKEHGKKSNKFIVDALSRKLSEKYDWLRNYCLVYNDLMGSPKHTFGGYFVSKLHFQDKCAIAFYLDKKVPIRHRDSVQTVKEIVISSQMRQYNRNQYKHLRSAKDVYENTTRGLNEKGIGWWGVACIKRHVGVKSSWAGDAVVIWEDTEKDRFIRIVLVK